MGMAPPAPYEPYNLHSALSPAHGLAAVLHNRILCVLGPCLREEDAHLALSICSVGDHI